MSGKIAGMIDEVSTGLSKASDSRKAAKQAAADQKVVSQAMDDLTPKVGDSPTGVRGRLGAAGATGTAWLGTKGAAAAATGPKVLLLAVVVALFLNRKKLMRA